MVKFMAQQKGDRKPNKLISEKSPYLLQHAFNPVNWYPWGDEAFEKAKSEDKPIFLSIGYSTCHWCHVMEKESFEDDQVAKLLNDNFISIKVDREERPDIDNVYMTVCQMLTGSGGWPLSIIMTPDKKPFFAGTYIPKVSRFQMLGMTDLIPKIGNLWKTQKNDILNSSEEITNSLKRSDEDISNKVLDDSIFEFAYGEFLSVFDESYGGFGKQPKFPSPHNLIFLIRNWGRNGSKKSLEMVEKTLDSMMFGGIWDHIGFGFHRYSTDRYWLVPHFEKMLYDQALLSMVFSEAYLASKNTQYKEIMDGILCYVLRDMTSSSGAFFSAEDADSEGEEGKFYLWEENEIRKNLGDDTDLFTNLFNISSEGNYYDEVSGKKNHKNIPHLKKSLDQLSKELNIPKKELEDKIDSSRKKLFFAREKRTRPQKDDKILTDWNGLMIAAFCKAYRISGNKLYLDSAEHAAEFILNNMKDKTGGLLHTFRDSEAKIPGFISDYTYFVWGLLELYQSNFKVKYLKSAIEFTKYINKHFWDNEKFGYFLTSDEAEELLTRQKIGYDGAIPSGNSVALMNLLKIAKITGETEFEERANHLLLSFSKKIDRHPSSYTMFLVALDFAIGPSYEIVVVGSLESEDTKRMLEKINKIYLPNKVVVLKEDENDEIYDLVPYSVKMDKVQGKTSVYVCKNFSCELPVTDLDDMLKLLDVK
jgi:uncharacterized protein YyaL (SSP411 family)